MKRYFLYITYYLSSMLALTACTDDENADIPVDQKTPIQLSVGSVSGTATSRAITVAPTSPLSSAAFAEATDLYLVMKSENGANVKWTMTKGNVAANATDVTFGDGFKRYWDDCYSRDAHLSVYGICTPGATPKITTIGGKSNYSHTGTPTTGAWGSDYTPTALTITDWSVSSEQTESTLKNEDLCYSNNISKYTVNSTETDDRLKFNSTEKKFTGGNMNFYHALSKITFVVQHNETFTDDEFKFADDTNISMKGMNVKNATFNIESGEFTGAYTTGNITKMYQTEKTDATKGKMYTLDALVLPGTDMSDDNKEAISFTIANNLYQLSKKDLLAKISSDDKTNKMLDSKKLKPGVNYIFTLNISKTQIIKITAKVVDWEIVNASELTPSNAHLNITTTSSIGAEMTSGFDLYRLLDTDNTTIDNYQGYNWGTGYTTENNNKNTVSYNSSATGSDKWQLGTSWYWDNNMTYYHFRAVSPSGTDITDTKSVALESKEVISESDTYKDVIWGAPLVSGLTKVTYSTTNGFDGTTPHQLFYAIGPTKDAINLTMFHVMSDVTFVIKTTTGAEAVDLTKVDGGNTKHTTITLKNIKKNGNVAMGNGLVSTTETASDFTFVSPAVTTKTVNSVTVDDYITWHAGFVPQSLSDVLLVITTPDNNEYIIKMADVIGTAPTYQNITYPTYTDNKVSYWYPGVKYSYTFKLTKTGIEKITASLVNWEAVEAGNDNVQIQ